MLDFGALPPEVNSARMYAGPGSGPMMAAASGWDALAGQLDSYAAGYFSAVSELHGQSWSGEASNAMTGAAAPFVAWLTTTAAQAEQAAGQARAAAAAYEAAFVATVPPPVVAANRLQLATLVATNFFGQNTPAIAATEAAYAEMWAQDAAAMYGYAAASLAASVLTPFSEPPQTTNPTGQSAQAAAVVHAVGTATAEQAQTTLPQLQSLASGASVNASAGVASSPIVTAFSTFNTLAGPITPVWQVAYSVFSAGNYGVGQRLLDLQAAKAAGKGATHAVTAAATAPATGAVRGEVLAGMNTADRVGKLSVPQGWATATPAAGPVAEPLGATSTAFRALPAWAANPATGTSGGTPPPGVLGPMANTAERRTGNAVFRMRDRRYKIPRPAVGG